MNNWQWGYSPEIKSLWIAGKPFLKTNGFAYFFSNKTTTKKKAQNTYGIPGEDKFRKKK